MNLELSRIETWFYISVVFGKPFFFFRIEIYIVTRPLYDVTIVDHKFTFKIDLEQGVKHTARDVIICCPRKDFVAQCGCPVSKFSLWKVVLQKKKTDIIRGKHYR